MVQWEKITRTAIIILNNEGAIFNHERSLINLLQLCKLIFIDCTNLVHLSIMASGAAPTGNETVGIFVDEKGDGIRELIDKFQKIKDPLKLFSDTRVKEFDFIRKKTEHYLMTQIVESTTPEEKKRINGILDARLETMRKEENDKRKNDIIGVISSIGHQIEYPNMHSFPLDDRLSLLKKYLEADVEEVREVYKGVWPPYKIHIERRAREMDCSVLKMLLFDPTSIAD